MKQFNILIITQDDPFYVRIFFEEFFKCYRPLSDIKGVVVAPAMGKKTFTQLLKQMHDFYGHIDFLRMGSKYAYYRLCSFLTGYLPLKRFYSIAGICRHHKVPVKNCANINSEEFLKDLRGMDLDLIISVAAPQIFKKKLIEIPRKGCINIHNAKLPKYRGMLPNFWQMLHGENAVWTTVHRINAGVDDGEILLQKETSIINGESLDSLIKRTKAFGASLIVETVDMIKTDTLRPKPNSKEDATYFTFPTKKDVREFRRKGHKLI